MSALTQNSFGSKSDPYFEANGEGKKSVLALFGANINVVDERQHKFQTRTWIFISIHMLNTTTSRQFTDIIPFPPKI